MFLENQISILKWFLKDHVTLKTGVMAAKRINYSIKLINYVLIYIKIENGFIVIIFHNITDFTLIFDKLNAALKSILDFINRWILLFILLC